MLFHLPAVRDYVRSVFNQASQIGFISNDEIDRWANEGYQKYCTKLMMAHEGFFETTKNLDIVGGSETIALPDNFTGDKKFLNSTILERQLSDRRIPLEYRVRYAANDINVTSGSAVSDHYLPTFKFRGPYIVLEPTPDSSESNALRLTYQAMPARLRSNNAQAGGAASITLDIGSDPRDDYYKDCRIFIVAGTGLGQLNKITAYNGTTKVATVASWTTVPDSTSVYSTLIHDDFPENIHEIIPLFAAKCAFQKERSRGINVEFDGSRLKELEKLLVDFCEQRSSNPIFQRAWNLEVE